MLSHALVLRAANRLQMLTAVNRLLLVTVLRSYHNQAPAPSERCATPVKSGVHRRVGRLPGIPSSQLGLQSYTGELDDFGVESFIGFPGEEEVPGPDMHSVMEAQLEMGTKPLKRTIF